MGKEIKGRTAEGIYLSSSASFYPLTFLTTAAAIKTLPEYDLPPARLNPQVQKRQRLGAAHHIASDPLVRLAQAPRG